jgi:hypothetical protein
MNTHLSSQIIDYKKGQGHMTLEIQIPACDRHKIEAGLNLLNGIATLSLLIIRSPTAIYI